MAHIQNGILEILKCLYSSNVALDSIDLYQACIKQSIILRLNIRGNFSKYMGFGS